MIKPEDFKRMDYEFFRALSKEGAVLVTKLPKGSIGIFPGIKRDSPSVKITESGGIELSEEGIKEYEGMNYLFIPEGSNDKDD